MVKEHTLTLMETSMKGNGRMGIGVSLGFLLVGLGEP